MTRTSSPIALLLAACIGFPSTALAAAPPTKPGVGTPKLPSKKASRPKLPGRMAGDRPFVDRDSILALNLGKAPIRKGPPSAFSTATVEIANGKRVRIEGIAGESKHEAMRKKLRALPKGAVFGAVKQSAEVYEFEDSFVVVTSTGATVADPAKVKAALPKFGRLAKSGSVHVDMDALTAESKRGLADFKKELAGYPKSHPLRQAAAKGDQALLDALARGVGDMEIVRTLHIPKKPPAVKTGTVDIPKVVGGKVDYSKTRTLERKSTLGPGTPIGNSAAQAMGPVDSGGRNETAEFVAGRTWGEGWVWEEQWNVPSGFLRVTLGAHYAVGLRVPIEVKTKMSPMWVCDDTGTREGRTSNFKLDVRAEAIDGDAAFYERAGMPSDLIANGDELALQAGVGYGVKLRLFWRTLVNRPYREVGIDWGRDFDPPQGSASQKVVEVFLPASVTQTDFDYGPLSGSARLGFKVDVRGKVRTRVSARQLQQNLLVVGRPSGSTPVSGDVRSTPQLLVSSSPTWRRYAFRLNNSTRPGSIPSYQQAFGYTVDQVEYDSKWSVVPGVKVNASARYAGYGISGTWTYWLDELEVPIGTLRLGRHPGTRTSLRNNDGRKLFKRSSPGWCVANNPNL
jgi:hypothetical protein